jgi:hypothetical protein
MVRAHELLFGEFAGSVLVEVPPTFTLESAGLPYREIGEVTSGPEFVIRQSGAEVLRESWTSLEVTWRETFREVLG